MQWAQKHMITNFQAVLCTDECHATLDGPYGWNSGWLLDGHHVPMRRRSQQGGGRVMFWSGNMGSDLVSLFSVPRGVKMTSAKYVEFLTAHLLPWYKRRTVPSGVKSFSCKTTHHSMLQKYHWGLGCYGHKGRKNSWCGHHHPLNPIENLWSILQRKLYEGGWQFTSKQQLSKPERKSRQILNMDERVVQVISKTCSHVNK